MTGLAHSRQLDSSPSLSRLAQLGTIGDAGERRVSEIETIFAKIETFLVGIERAFEYLC